MVCQIAVGPQFKNFMSLGCIFTGSMALESLDCYPKMSIFFYKMFSLACLKEKTNKKPENCLKLFLMSKTVLPIFG